MESVLIMSKNTEEGQEIGDRIGKEFDILTITSPEGLDEKAKRSELVLIDFGYMEHYGADFLIEKWILPLNPEAGVKEHYYMPQLF